jgi:hypothetical protein
MEVRQNQDDILVNLQEEYEKRQIQEVLDQLDKDLIGLIPVKTRIKEVAALLEQFSSDSESDDDDPNDGVIYLDDDEPVAVEVFREKTIEDIIEEQRAKLASEGKVGTPVTAESFAKWRAAKLAKRQADAEAKVKIELTKKKGGKGLSVLSGKELFNFNAALFVDDDAALDATEENALNADTKRSEEEAEAIAKAEAERAQEEQLRLLEIHRLEVIGII